MPITPGIDNWLITAGYEYHCFISWAHTENPEYTMCARIMKQEIEQRLALSIPNPRVFLDESEILGGADWEKVLLRALCRSVSMVSLCAPIYFHPRHLWCGKEWAAMSNLSKKRLPDADFYSIIPLRIRGKVEEFPKAVSTIQCVDFSNVTIRGRKYFTSFDFRKRVQEIVDRIEMIAEVTAANNSQADCSEFELPIESAFSDYHAKALGLPFRGA